MKNRLVIFVLAFTAFPAFAQESPSYTKQVRPLLAKYCLECHNAKALKGGLDLESHKAILEGADNGPVVVPGKAGESKLIALMDGKEKPLMPPPRYVHRPSKDDIETMRAWINAGAKDDVSPIKVSLPEIKSKKTLSAPVVGLAYWPEKETPLGLLTAKDRKITLSGTKETDILPTLDPVTTLYHDADHKFAAIATGLPGSHGEVSLLSWIPGQKPLFQTTPLKHKDMILDLAVSRDGTRIASAGYDTRIRLGRIVQDAGEGSPRMHVTEGPILKDHSDAVFGLAFRPDGKMLASCSADRTVKIWDTETGKLLFTLGEATDWLFDVAWSSDGVTLATGGVDKSIRVYRITPQGSKLVKSVFAHEGPVLKLAFSAGGKSLYSLGQDRVVKTWNTFKMTERQVFDSLPEDGLTLAVHPANPLVAIGLYDGSIHKFDTLTGMKAAALQGLSLSDGVHWVSYQDSGPVEKDLFPIVNETGANDSPGRGQAVPLPATVVGQLERAGDVDYFRVQMGKGQSFGVEIVVAKEVSKLEPVLQLFDPQGNLIDESDRGFLGHTFVEAGMYALGVRDRELRGGTEFKYRLKLGEIPVVTAIHPLGGQRGQTVKVALTGVFLEADSLRVEIPRDAKTGSKISVPATSKKGTPLGMPQLLVGEYAELGMSEFTTATILVPPAVGNGVIEKPGQTNLWGFNAQKGQRLVLEINARRMGSRLDSVIEVLDAKGQPVPRAVLRCVAKTNVTFRDHDSVTPNIRLEQWSDLSVDDLLYVGSELVKIKALPAHPDADCTFFSVRGNRLSYFDTTPTHHSNNVPMYKVSVHPPWRTFSPNGFPIFPLSYRNDDGGPGYGRDSRILFDPPWDGAFRLRVSDARDQGGPEFGYRLTVRPPQPSFNVSFSPTAPVVPKGGAIPLAVTVDRLDGYEGPLDLRFENVPPGVHVPAIYIGAGDSATAVALYANADVTLPAQTMPLKIVGEALIEGEKQTKAFSGGVLKIEEPGDLVTRTEEASVTIKPGSETRLTVQIERRNKFAGRVPLEVRGLPHGVKVLDIGLNGILITEGETKRTVTIYAEPWVAEAVYPLVILAKREGKNSEHAAKAVMLKVAK